jgi:3-methyladenine DNA glycosylase AlkD
MTVEQIVEWIKSQSDSEAIKGQARFGITSKNNFGVSINKLRPFAKGIGKNHNLAVQLWDTEIHEARLLATMIDEPGMVTEKQMEKWVRDFNSWDICDQCCSNLFDKTGFAFKKVFEWTKKEEEFIKRAGFVLMATLSVHDKNASDKDFEQFFPVILREATDERNFVKKAVNWAIRQIGKRNIHLNKKALGISKQVFKIGNKSARWIANDAIKELTNEKILSRLKAKEKH